MLQCVAVCCSAVCCSVLQCATACISVCCGVFSSRPDPVSPMSHSLGGMLAPDSVWIVTVAVLPKSLSVCRRWWRLTKCVSIATTVSPQTPSDTCRSYRQVFTHLDEPPYLMYQFCSLAASQISENYFTHPGLQYKYQTLVKRIRFSRIWSSAQDYVVLVLLLSRIS